MDHDSTTNRTETLDDWLEQWRTHGGWQARKAEVQRLVDEIERLRTKLAGHDEGLDRWCNYQDRLVETLDRLGLRKAVLFELERDGWKNVPVCRHAETLAGVAAQALLDARGPCVCDELGTLMCPTHNVVSDA